MDDFTRHQRFARNGGRIALNPPTTVAILGFEPAIQRSLETLLASESDWQVISFPSDWSRWEHMASPQVFLVAPPSPNWAERLRQNFPVALILAQVDWTRRYLYQDLAIFDFFDGFSGYAGVIQALRGARDHLTPPPSSEAV